LGNEILGEGSLLGNRVWGILKILELRGKPFQSVRLGLKNPRKIWCQEIFWETTGLENTGAKRRL